MSRSWNAARASLLLLPILWCAHSADAAGFDAPTVDALVGKALQVWAVPGAAVVIVNGDKVLYVKGHGVRELGKDAPVTPDTVFPLGSCSKAFTTTLMAQLVDAGTISWDDPVRKHLPYFHLSDPHADALVTLSDLVSHRTGLGPHDLLWYRATWSQEEMIRRAGRLPLSRPFRTTMQYQSVMVTAAGHAAARAAGRPWADLVRERLLEPLGMRTASLRAADALALVDHAGAHQPGGDGKLKPVPWYRVDEPNPAGTMNASANDLASWLQFHLNEGEHRGKRLISAENLGATHAPQTIIPVEGKNRAEHPETHQMSYGMGWVIQDYRGALLVSHAGIIDGFRVHLALLPKQKFALAILANVHATRMNLALGNQIIDHLLGLSAKDWNGLYQKLVADDEVTARLAGRRLEEQRLRGTTPTLPLESFTGTFEHEAYGTARIERDGGKLVWRWSGFRCPLEHFHFDVFRLRGEPLFDLSLLEFQTEGGSVKGFHLFDLTFRRVEAKH